MAKEERKMVGDVEVIWKELTAEEEEKLIAEARWKAKLDYNSQISYAEKRGMEKGKQLGLEEGAQNKSKEIAKKMLKKGNSIDDIAEITGLTKEKIENL